MKRSVRQRARDAGLSEDTVAGRLHQGWSLRRALSTPTAPRRQTTAAERAEAVASVLAGRETQRAVARRLGVTAAAVGIWLRPHQAAIPRPVHPMRERVLELVRGGDTYAEIYRVTGVHPPTISGWVREAGITPAARGSRPRSAEPTPRARGARPRRS